MDYCKVIELIWLIFGFWRNVINFLNILLVEKLNFYSYFIVLFKIKVYLLVELFFEMFG